MLAACGRLSTSTTPCSTSWSVTTHRPAMRLVDVDVLVYAGFHPQAGVKGDLVPDAYLTPPVAADQSPRNSSRRRPRRRAGRPVRCSAVSVEAASQRVGLTPSQRRGSGSPGGGGGG